MISPTLQILCVSGLVWHDIPRMLLLNRPFFILGFLFHQCDCLDTCYVTKMSPKCHQLPKIDATSNQAVFKENTIRQNYYQYYGQGFFSDFFLGQVVDREQKDKKTRFQNIIPMELVNYLNGDTLINYKSTISPKSTFLLTPKVSENMSDWPMSDSPIILL